MVESWLRSVSADSPPFVKLGQCATADIVLEMGEHKAYRLEVRASLNQSCFWPGERVFSFSFLGYNPILTFLELQMALEEFDHRRHRVGGEG